MNNRSRRWLEYAERRRDQYWEIIINAGLEGDSDTVEEYIRKSEIVTEMIVRHAEIERSMRRSKEVQL